MGKRAQIRREKQLEVEKRRKEAIAALRKSKNPWASFWRRVDFWIYTVCLLLLIVYPILNPYLQKLSDTSVVASAVDTAIMHTSKGDIELELYKKDAPKTVENFEKLAQKGYYNNLTFHRVIKDFMIQGGDPNGDGTGGESAWGGKFEDEINPKSVGVSEDTIKQFEGQGYKYNYNLTSHKVEVGSLAMANSGPNTNGSQFFIVTEKPQPHLDGKHTVFGMVTKGMETVSAIAAVETGENDKPKEPVMITGIDIK